MIIEIKKRIMMLITQKSQKVGIRVIGRLNTEINHKFGVPVLAQWLTNPTSNHEVAGSVPARAQWVKDPAFP